MNKNTVQKKDRGMKWNLGLLYKSPTDPQIEKDVASLEKAVSEFAKKYDTDAKDWLHDAHKLLSALIDYEMLMEKAGGKFLLYFYFMRDSDAKNPAAASNISLLEGRIANIDNRLTFFKIAIGRIPSKEQPALLSNKSLEHFKVFLSRIFADAKHDLSVPEEKIMNLKAIPSYNMWVSANERILNMKSVAWKGKDIPVAQALSTVQQLKTQKERNALATSLTSTLKEVAPISEAEMNAVVTNKKINDELRGFTTPYEETVLGYRNDPKVVETLVKVVSDNVDISHRFHKLKAKLLGLKSLLYSDRAAKIGTVKTKFDFASTGSILRRIYKDLNPKYIEIFDTMLKDGRIDVYPRVGKKSGAYCWGTYEVPAFLLLNHTDDLYTFTTVAHEMGHAIHSHMSRSQGALYHGYSTAMAETASTLFEAIALEHVYDSLSDKEKIIVLHDKINDDISTIFRQIAAFNFEKDIHATIRAKGYATERELAEMHNKHMSTYLGPLFKFTEADGYYFVHWSHLRYFFYVYTYAFGQLVSKAMLRRYKADPKFWKSIEKFLSAGGKDSPENILKEIGIDVRSPDFFREGLREIEDDITKLEKLTRK